MKLFNCTAPVLIIGLGVGIALSGCKTQSPQTSSQQLPQPPSVPSSSPSQPSIPSTPSPPSLPSTPSLPGSSDSSSQSSRESSQQKTPQGSPQTAEETYGARPGSEQRKSEDIPDLDSTPSGDGEDAQQELLEVLADIDATLEQAANDPNATEEQQARIEQYQQVLGDLEVSVTSDDLDPEALEALLDVLSGLEETIAAAAVEQSQNNRSDRNKTDGANDDIPITITVEQVAILQDLIDILGIPGAPPGTGFPSIPSASIPVGLPRTGSEKLGDLDATLEASIGVFDGMILSERVNTQGKPGEFEGEGEIYTSGGEGLFEEGTLGEEGEGGTGGEQQQAQAPEIPSDQQSTSQSQGGSGGGGGANQSAIPNDIPDGRDDDIVARQIREAASNETDPELREKLWEEYRRYKKGK